MVPSGWQLLHNAISRKINSTLQIEFQPTTILTHKQCTAGSQLRETYDMYVCLSQLQGTATAPYNFTTAQ